ncbi:22 kDa alpha-zein 4-like [Phragmites australis]|uniref:22 kDa alpha-zein 4-like n=1 Tax=Phragmites australis TaxID=29695 RepID=UPI002D781A7C|nr:22 kDa alpha-zein 4-like [Phragmites australis]
MAAKIIVLFAFLALSISVTSAVTFPRYFPSVSVLGATHPSVQYNILQNELAVGISPSSAVIIQQQLDFLRQQSLAHLTIQDIAAQQQLFNPQALVNPAANWRRQQLYNLLAMASTTTYLQQQQQQEIFNQVFVVSPIANLQQQQQQQILSQLALVSPIAYWQQQQKQQQQQQLFNQLATASLVAYSQQQQQQQLFNPLALVSPIAYWQQEQQLFNPQALATPAAYRQQIFASGASL